MLRDEQVSAKVLAEHVEYERPTDGDGALQGTTLKEVLAMNTDAVDYTYPELELQQYKLLKSKQYRVPGLKNDYAVTPAKLYYNPGGGAAGGMATSPVRSGSQRREKRSSTKKRRSVSRGRDANASPEAGAGGGGGAAAGAGARPSSTPGAGDVSGVVEGDDSPPPQRFFDISKFSLYPAAPSYTDSLQGVAGTVAAYPWYASAPRQIGESINPPALPSSKPAGVGYESSITSMSDASLVQATRGGGRAVDGAPRAGTGPGTGTGTAAGSAASTSRQRRSDRMASDRSSDSGGNGGGGGTSAADAPAKRKKERASFAFAGLAAELGVDLKALKSTRDDDSISMDSELSELDD
jgi:hypothetical protein